MTRKQKKNLIRIVVTAVLLGILALLPIKEVWNGWLRFLLYLIPYGIIGYDVLRKAAESVIHRQPFDENFLMAVATIGAAALGEYTEACAVMLFYQIGELFQSIAVGKSRKSISSLMDIRPDYANIEKDGRLTRVSPDTVPAGSIIVVQPGEKVPIDGIVTEGSSSLDTSALTGESLPREVAVGDDVISGSINQSGLLHVRTTRPFGESTASRILDLVENSSMKKARAENFITRFARVYTPAVVYLALALAVLVPLIRMAAGVSPDWQTWIMRALTFLVISCPCALVISIPLSFFGGIGGASREGILIKGSNYMETLSNVKTVVMDKTGTLTRGTFEVTAVHMDQMDKIFRSDGTSPLGKALVESALLEISALAECHSTHPISRSIREAYNRAAGLPLDENRVGTVKEYPGYGLEADVDGNSVLVGSHKLMVLRGIPCDECELTGTIIHVAIDGKYAGHIVISDVIKPTARQAIASLKAAGVTRTVMLTGDTEKVAASVANELGISEYHSSLLPQDKVEIVEQLLSRETGHQTLAFVGDGINDAPVLARADLGMAMGALGSDAAIEAADVVLMDDDPVKISKAIKIARKCMRIVYENIYFAILVKVICLVLSALGLANMWMAVFADVGVMVIAVLNAIRCLYVKHL